MNEPTKKTFQATLSQLPEMLQWVRSICQKNTLETQHLELAAEEALVNIITYAYEPKSKNPTIEMQFSQDEDQSYRLLLIDHGRPYNPLARLPQLEDIHHHQGESPGGYGVFLICNMVTAIHYERQGEFNCLTLIQSSSSS